MAKFTAEERMEIAIEYLGGKESSHELGRKIGADHKAILKWAKLYELQGVEGFIKEYTNYSAQFKINVLNYMIENRTSICETAAIFNIPSPTTISVWKKAFEEKGYDGLFQRRRGRPSMSEKKQPSAKKPPEPGSIEAMQNEIDRLRMENAYLKKLNALVQKEKKLKNAKKLK